MGAFSSEITPKCAKLELRVLSEIVGGLLVLGLKLAFVWRHRRRHPGRLPSEPSARFARSARSGRGSVIGDAATRYCHTLSACTTSRSDVDAAALAVAALAAVTASLPLPPPPP